MGLEILVKSQLAVAPTTFLAAMLKVSDLRKNFTAVSICKNGPMRTNTEAIFTNLLTVKHQISCEFWKMHYYTSEID